MRRREFVGLVGGAAAWPLAARAQQDGRMRLVGMLIAAADNDTLALALVAAFREALTRLGWVQGRNLRLELRFGAGNAERMRVGAAELVALAPDAIVVGGSTPAAKELRERSQTVPIVFVGVNDPVATGLVGNLARPDGNATGFPLFEPSIAGKWLELLKEAAPHVRRVAQLSDPANAPEVYVAAIEAAAGLLGVRVTRFPVRNVVDIVRTIDAFAAEPAGALLLPPDDTTLVHRETIFGLAVQHRLPAFFCAKYYAHEGALMSYGPDPRDLPRRAASYVDRLLRGAKVSELPVQFPTKYELVVNLKTAKAIGLTIPEAFLLRADEVIE
jgi:ABC-type uncharacterized transport system substrate-binding protein